MDRSSFIREVATHRSTKARGNFRRLFIEDDGVLENQPNRLPLAEGSCTSQTPGDLCDGGSSAGSALTGGLPFPPKDFSDSGSQDSKYDADIAGGSDVVEALLKTNGGTSLYHDAHAYPSMKG